MNRYSSIVYVLLVILCIPCSLFAQYRYTIEGRFDNSVLGGDHPNSVKDGHRVILDFINSDQKDTIIVKDGGFRFEGIVDIPSVAMVNIENMMGTLVLIDNSRYVYTFTQEKVSDRRFRYDIRLETESTFYNLWESLAQKKGALLSKKSELQRLIEEGGSLYAVRAYEEELATVDEALSELYFSASTEHRGTYEMTYLLPAAPDFSYQRYIGFYNDLPEPIKNSFYGKNLYDSLIRARKDEEK